MPNFQVRIRGEIDEQSQQRLQSLTDSINNTLNRLTRILNEHQEEISRLSGVMQTTHEELHSIFQDLTAFAEYPRDLFQAIHRSFSNLQEQTARLFESVFEAITGRVRETGHRVSSALHRIEDPIAKALSAFYDELRSFLERIKNEIKAKIEEHGREINRRLEPIAEYYRQYHETIRPLEEQAEEAVIRQPRPPSVMYEQTQELAQQIQEANRRIGADAQDLTEFTKQTTEQAKQVASQSSQNLSQTYRAISQAMLSAAIRHSQTISQTTQQTSQAIANGLDQSVIAFLTAFNRAFSRTSRQSSSLLQLLPVLIGLGVQAISRITNELRQSAPRVARRLSRSLQSISQSFASILYRRSRSIADATQQTVEQAGRSFSNRLSRAMQSFSSTISQAFSRATNRARSLFQTILAPITGRTPTRPTAEAGAEADAGAGAIAGASTTLLTITAIATAITAAVMVIRSILQILQAFYNRLLRSSAILQSVHDLFSRTWEFYFKPIGDVLGLLLLPVALTFFRRAIAFYRSFIPIFQRIGDWISGRASFSDFLADILNADNISRTTKNLVVMLIRFADAIAFIQGLVIGAFRGFGRALADAISPLTAAFRSAASSSHEFLNVLDPQRWAEFGNRLGYIAGQVLGEIITWPWQSYLRTLKSILDLLDSLRKAISDLVQALNPFSNITPADIERMNEGLMQLSEMPYGGFQTGGIVPAPTIARLHPGEYVLTPAEFTLLIHAISDLRDAITYQPRPTPRPPPTINVNLTIEAEPGLDRTKLESLADDLVDIISRKLAEVGP